MTCMFEPQTKRESVVVCLSVGLRNVSFRLIRRHWRKYRIFFITTANCTWGGIFLHKLQLSSCTKVPGVSYFYNHHTRALDDNSKQQQIIARPTTKTKIISFNTLKWSIFQWLILNIPLLTIADQNIWIIEIGAKWMNKWKWV